MNPLDTIIVLLYLLFEIILYCCSILQNVVWINEVRYASIALCFAFGVFTLSKTGQDICRKKYLVLGLLFTCVADYYLVLQNRSYEVGISFFIIVQLYYYLYIEYENLPKERFIRIVGRVTVACVFTFLVSVYRREVDWIVILALFYAVSSIDNIFLCARQYRKWRRFTIGLILLFCCDICVACANISTNDSISQVIRWFIWLFYVPSQVMISLSVWQKGLE